MKARSWKMARKKIVRRDFGRDDWAGDAARALVEHQKLVSAALDGMAAESAVRIVIDPPGRKKA